MRVDSIRTPVSFAARRLRSRLLALVGLTAALAGAAALIGSSSLTAALAQEKSVRVELDSLPTRYRSIHVRYYTLPLEGDFRAAAVEQALQGFAASTTQPRRVQVWHSIEPDKPRGTRLVIAAAPRRDVTLTSGRLPRGCRGRTCEAVVLSGRWQLGTRISLPRHRFAVVVGRGSLPPEVMPDRGQLGREALLVHSLARPLRRLVRDDGSTVVYSAALDPERVRGFELGGLRARLRETIVRLERGDPLVRATAPLGTLRSLDERARVARERLLLVAGPAAALLIAFAAFVAGARRRDGELAAAQLVTLGASRAQVWTARAFEAVVPTAAALVISIAGLVATAAALAERRDLPSEFVRSALPLETLLAILVAEALACGLLLASVTPRRRSRFGIGTLELAAATALAVIVWQTWTTGALDPARVASGRNPVVLLVPTLGFFATGVLLLRLLPLALRTGERAARRGPTATRLAFLTAARTPAQAAAATTFLAVALGSAVFSLSYRATLEQQAGDQARFAAGASWRVVERGPARQPNVTPLTRYARVSTEKPTPVVRIGGDVAAAYPEGARLPVTVLAVPSARLPKVLGWRRDFSALTPDEIGRRLRPQPVRLAGPQLADDASELRVWARSKTDYPRIVVLHLLRPGGDFAHVRFGVARRRWRRLELRLPPGLRGSQLVGVEYAPTYAPNDFKYDPTGYVDLSRIEQRIAATWMPLPSLGRWVPTTLPDGTTGILLTRRVRQAPVEHVLRFNLNGTFRPLIHPSLGLPAPDPGFETGSVPVLVSGPLAAQAVDGLLTIDLPGKQVEGRVVGSAALFPTITDRQSSFVIVDYDTLFAAMNADEPGLLAPTEAWFFRPQASAFASLLRHEPFRLQRAVDVAGLETRLLSDPLAAGTRTLLGFAVVVAALLSLIGLVLAERAAVATERLQLAEYEALGVPRSTLRRSAQVRLLALSALGIAAGLLGGLVSAHLTGAFVAVTGTAKRPLPPIATVVAWPGAAVVIGAVVVAGAAAAALVAGRALGAESAAKRLRA
jgi:hypothetical protein